MASSSYLVGAPLEVTQHGATPAAPSAGSVLLYPKTDGKFYTQTPAGVESPIAGSSSSGSSSGTVPYYVDAATTFVVPDNMQMLFTLPIDVDGYLQLDGLLVEV